MIYILVFNLPTLSRNCLFQSISYKNLLKILALCQITFRDFLKFSLWKGIIMNSTKSNI